MTPTKQGKIMKNFQKLFISIFQSKSGGISSKRLLGLLCGISLIVGFFISMYSKHAPSGELINALVIICFGSLGLTTIDSFKKDNNTGGNNNGSNNASKDE